MAIAFLKSAYRYPLVRYLVHRFGPAVWRLPQALRRRICHESQIRRLPGTRVWWYGESEAVRPAANGAELPTRGHRLASRAYRLGPPFLARIPQGWLVGKHCCPVTADRRVLLTAFRDGARILGLEPNADLESFVGRIENGGTDARALSGDVMPLVGRLDTNYFHWLTESCAQIEGLEIYQRETGRSPTVLIRGGGPAYLRESLELLGVSSGQIAAWEETTPPTAVNGLVVGSIPGNRVACAPRSLRWLRERFLAGARVSAQGGRKLYIRRRVGGWRSAVNDEELSNLLAGRGFEVVRPEGMSLADQVRMFAQADVIIGMHGAGLANILFAPRATLIELTGAYGGGEYYSMSTCLGNPYHPLPCAPEGKDGHDVVVDCQRLLDVLDRVIPVGNSHVPLAHPPEAISAYL